MRRTLIAALVLGGGAVAWLWLGGGFDQVAAWAAGEQRAFQTTIARTLRALRGGDAGAYAALLGACFAYGFFHAIGPGHGKLLVGGYGMARDVSMLRLSLIALVSSLGQAVTAILLAFGGLWLLGLTRERMIGAAEDLLAPLSYGMISLIGMWLVWRGVARLRRSSAALPHDHSHDHSHEHSGATAVCDSCGHRHGPTPEEVGKATGLRDALVLIGGIAVRPCTGALFVLIITWQMEIAMAGVAGAFAMALGTATVTIAVGLAAGGLRGGFIRGIAGASALAWFMPLLEIAAGTVVVFLSVGMMLRAV